VPQLDHRRASDRVLTELIEADIEIAFSLADLAQECLHRRDPASAARVIRDAGEVLLDIQQRLEAIGAEKASPFDPLLGEVHRAIALAKSCPE
jgi:hypothetical protein